MTAIYNKINALLYQMQLQAFYTLHSSHLKRGDLTYRLYSLSYKKLVS